MSITDPDARLLEREELEKRRTPHFAIVGVGQGVNENFSDAPMPGVGPSILLRPLSACRFHMHDVLEVPAVELVRLVVGEGAAERLSTARGYLHDTPETRALEQQARKGPEDFGVPGWIVLGADALVPARSEGFTDRVWIHGVELIDGNQRLRTLALVLDELGPEHLERTLLKVEVHCGAGRERARRMYGRADRHQNVRDAQDRLLLCPHVRRLEAADWERWTFRVRRGVTGGPNGRTYLMPEVTRALACLSGPGPELAHRTASPEGMLSLWGDTDSLAYSSLFHSRMTPLGVMRAVECYRAAQAALERMPSGRREGHGRLMRYAPELIHWASCRFLPWERLHENSGDFDWDGELRHSMGDHTEAAFTELVRRYEQRVPFVRGQGTYSRTAGELWLWRDLARGL
ncbi:hypothetical protein [Streptomyces parvus]|uniref:hypothetical protein n=1 Tax=Streptomyces parvus TaxID=66428 RepID=UPI003D712924